MHTGIRKLSSEKPGRLDLAVTTVVCLALAFAVLYPETFIINTPRIGSQNISPLNLLLPVLALAIAVYGWAGRASVRIGTTDYMVLLYSGYLVMRNMFGQSDMVAVKYAAVGLSMYYLLTLITVRRPALTRAIILVMVSLTAVTTLYGLMEYALQENFLYQESIAEVVRDPAVGLHRVGSTLAHPVPYGAFLIQMAPFAILVWLSAVSRWQRGLGIATTLLIALGIIFTFSKGSWLVALIMAAAALLFFRGGRSRRVMLPVLIIAGVLAFTLVLSWQQVRFETETRAEGSIDVRLVGWRAAIDGIADNPLTGVGLRQGEQELKLYIDPEWYELADRPLPVDNYYLSLLLEAGFIGLAIWAVMFALIIAEGIRVVRVSGPMWPWALASLASMIGVSLNAFTFEAMHIWSNFIIFWTAAGIIHGLRWIDDDREPVK